MRRYPYKLMVDSGSEDEPDVRWFKSLPAALSAFNMLDPQWQKFAWVMYVGEPCNIVFVKDGKPTRDAL